MIFIHVFMHDIDTESIKNKHLLWQKYEKNPTTENKNNYLQFRNKLTGLLRKSERTYLEGQLDLYHNDMGKAWKVLRSVLNQNTNNRNPSTLNLKKVESSLFDIIYIF